MLLPAKGGASQARMISSVCAIISRAIRCVAWRGARLHDMRRRAMQCLPSNSTVEALQSWYLTWHAFLGRWILNIAFRVSLAGYWKLTRATFLFRFDSVQPIF